MGRLSKYDAKSSGEGDMSVGGSFRVGKTENSSCVKSTSYSPICELSLDKHLATSVSSTLYQMNTCRSFTREVTVDKNVAWMNAKRKRVVNRKLCLSTA